MRRMTVAAAALLALACPAQGRPVFVVADGEHNPVRINTTSPQNQYPVSGTKIAINIENNSIITAYYLEGPPGKQKLFPYSLQVGTIENNLTIHLGRSRRTGCDRDYIEDFQLVSNDVDTLIADVLDFRYFAMNCRSVDLKARAIRFYCANLFRLKNTGRFELYSDFGQEVVQNQKSCESKIKAYLA